MNMKKVTVLFITFLFSFIIMGCGVNTVGDWVFSLQDVECRDDVQQVYGESKISSFDDEGITNYSYEDDIVKISMLPFGKKISFSLQNKSQNSIKIIWDESAYIENGISDKVIHSEDTKHENSSQTDMFFIGDTAIIGAKYIKDTPQTPTIIEKDTTINGNIVPFKNIFYIHMGSVNQVGSFRPTQKWSVGIRSLLSGWTNYIVTQEEFDDYIQKNTGKIIKVSLALQIEDITNYYIFSFLAEGFRQKK